VQEQSVVSATKEIQVEADQARAPAPKQLSSVGPNATILKVGSSAVAQPKLGGLILKGPSEKPTLVAKPTVPTPVKSPWASLPPVDKVPPVPINPPQQQYLAQRFSQRDPHGFDSMPPPPSPAKEIAADDFNRSWRDHHAGSSRELFNSQSGRYELVNDARRGSIRNEQNFRPPSLLQRPLQNDQQGPAEPSAAFQTSRSSVTQDAGAWSRRRTSSNVSGGSGSYGRRMSFGKGQELPSIPSDNHQQRRGSQPSGTADRVASPRNITTSVSDQSQQQYPPRGLSPAQTHQHQPWQIRQSPRLNNAHLTGQLSGPERPPQAAATPVDQASLSPSASEAQDPVAMQKRLMRERRELAVKRKQEQEERDEAEKKERIRLKMQALGLPPLDEEKEKASDRTFGERPATDGTGAPAQSPPKPPVPEILGEPKQYGMMKVHHPQSIKRLSSLKEPSVDQASESAASSRQVSPPSADAKPESKNNTESSALNGMQSAPQLVAPKGRLDERPGRPAESSPQERKEQPWKNVPSGSDTYTSWGGSSMTTHSAPGANLWGPPGSDKALGNGTFDRNLVRLPQRQSPHHQQVSPPAPGPIGPIGPPTAAPTILPSQTYGVTSERSHEDIQTVPAFSTPEIRTTRPKDQMKHETRNQDGKLGKELRHPRPIAPPSGPASLSRQQHTTVVGNMVTSGWNNFHVTATREEAERNERDVKERAERLVEEARTGIKREAQMPAINETWRQTSIEDNAGQRKVIGVSKTTNNGQGFGDRQQGPQTGRTPPFDNAMGAPIAISAMPSGAGAGRGSRFFPQMGDTDPTQGRRSVSYSPGYTRPASPPPPDSVDHPAYAGDIRRPMVSLPFVKPKPTVKLPPAMLAPVAPPILSPMLAPTQPLRVVSQPLVNTASWQDRFNGLFGRKASPEKKHALAVNSATKVPLEVALNQVSAAVSLPRSEDGDHTAKMFDAGGIASKAMEDEEALFEEREFGSLPTVRIPRAAPPAVWQPAKAPSNQRPRSKLFKATQVLSIEPMIWSLHDKENQRPDGFLISVRLPGEAITKARIMTRNHGSSHIPRGQRNPSSNFKPRKGIKSRESSGNFGSSKPAQNQLSIAPIPNTNIRPTFNSGTWARRVSGIVQ